MVWYRETKKIQAEGCRFSADVRHSQAFSLHFSLTVSRLMCSDRLKSVSNEPVLKLKGVEGAVHTKMYAVKEKVEVNTQDTYRYLKNLLK